MLLFHLVYVDILASNCLCFLAPAFVASNKRTMSVYGDSVSLSPAWRMRETSKCGTTSSRGGGCGCIFQPLSWNGDMELSGMQDGLDGQIEK